MTSTLCSDPIDALLPHRRRYRAALQNPAGDPLCWLVADSPVAFDADEVLADPRPYPRLTDDLLHHSDNLQRQRPLYPRMVLRFRMRPLAYFINLLDL